MTKTRKEHYKAYSDTFRKNLNYLLDKYKTPKTAIAEHVGTNTVSIFKFCRGEVREAKISLVVACADFFECSMEDLLKKDFEEELKKIKKV